MLISSNRCKMILPWKKEEKKGLYDEDVFTYCNGVIWCRIFKWYDGKKVVWIADLYIEGSYIRCEKRHETPEGVEKTIIKILKGINKGIEDYLKV